MPVKNNKTTRTITELLVILERSGTILASKKVTAGFDGFVDTIVNVIKNKQVNKPPVLFKTKKEFGNHILQTEGTNCSLELEEKNIKPGGNMPIMANAMASLGITVNCVGALGYPQTHPVFKTLSSNCHLHTFTDPGTSTAIEFNDGKILLGQMGKLNTSGWQNIKDIIGLEKIIFLYKHSDMLSIVNWAEIDSSTDIWKGLLKEVLLAYTSHDKRQTAFFDLSDCSKRSIPAIKEALMLIKQFAGHTKVMAGLNQNEATRIYQVLYGASPGKQLHYLGEKIFEKLEIDTLVLHSNREAIGLSKEDVVCCDSFFVKKPKISTGAGDNFNAGFCAARLLDLSLVSSLTLAHCISALYVKNGFSPQLNDVIIFLKNKLKEK